MRTFPLAFLVFSSALAVTSSRADEPPAPPQPYSVPWQLRPAAAATVVRSDTSVALYNDPENNAGTTVATMLLGSVRLTSAFAPMARFGVVSNSPPSGEAGVSFVNPVIGGTYVLALNPEMRLAFFLGLTIPVGMGGGNEPDPGEQAAAGSGVLARSAMDNAMFAVNDFTVFPGVSFAYVRGGLTVQVEATLLQLTRARGEDVQKDSSKTNFTSGLHVGYFAIPELSIGADLRYQRWLSEPAAVKDAPEKRDTFTFAVGPRAHLRLSDTMWIRPGLSYARGFDDPMSGLGYNVVQIDIPVSF